MNLTGWINGRERFHWKSIIALTFAIFLGMSAAGMVVNVFQMALDYAVTTYTSDKFMQWQDDQIKQYQHDHPGSHPETKDHPGGNSEDL